VIIKCYQTPWGRQIELSEGDVIITITESGTTYRNWQTLPGFSALELLKRAAEVRNSFESTWASHFEGVPYAPGDRAAP